MPQISPAYAVGRVRVLERTLLGSSQLERLMAVQTVEELARALVEMNWAEVRGRADIERMCGRHTQQAAQLVRDCSSDPQPTDCFLIQYDALNLKVLYKAKALGEEAALSDMGTLEPAKLRQAVEEGNYRELPRELAQAMEDIERHSAVKMDPLYVDAQLDKAAFALIANRMKGCKEATVKQYFACKAELANLMIALRSAAMGRGAAFAGALFVPGGELKLEQLAQVVQDPQRAWNLISQRPYGQALKAAVKEGDLAAIERAGDDYLLSLVRPHRYEPTSLLPLVGYLLARTRESQVIRLLATAKAAGAGQDKIFARLRALY